MDVIFIGVGWGLLQFRLWEKIIQELPIESLGLLDIIIGHRSGVQWTFF